MTSLQNLLETIGGTILEANFGNIQLSSIVIATEGPELQKQSKLVDLVS